MEKRFTVFSRNIKERKHFLGDLVRIVGSWLASNELKKSYELFFRKSIPLKGYKQFSFTWPNLDFQKRWGFW